MRPRLSHADIRAFSIARRGFSTTDPQTKRYGTLDEQIAPILFLASDEASYITGSILPVAGGDSG